MSQNNTYSSNQNERYEVRKLAREFDIDFARDMAAQFWRDGKIIRISLMGGGYSNANFLVESESESFVLRCYPGEIEAGQREMALHEKLLTKNLAVPRIFDFAISDQGKFVVWMEKKPGVLLSLILNDPDQTKMLSSVGESLAQIHSLTFPKAGLLAVNAEVKVPFEDFSEKAKELLNQCIEGRAGERLGLSLSSALTEFCDHRWHLVKSSYAGPRLVHGDFNPKNLLIDLKTHKVSAVLDWEYAMAGHPLMDIGNFLRFEEDFSVNAVESFLTGYKMGGGALSEEWKEAAKLLDLLSMAFFLNRKEELPKTFHTAEMVIKRTLGHPL